MRQNTKHEIETSLEGLKLSSFVSLQNIHISQARTPCRLNQIQFLLMRYVTNAYARFLVNKPASTPLCQCVLLCETRQHFCFLFCFHARWRHFQFFFARSNSILDLHQGIFNCRGKYFLCHKFAFRWASLRFGIFFLRETTSNPERAR